MGVNVGFGGNASNYMDPPSGQLSGLLSDMKGGGGSFIANLLDALGVQKQVANQTENSESSKSSTSSGGQTSESSGGGITVPAIEQASQMFEPTLPPPQWGMRFLDSIKPMQVIDPNTGF